MSRPELIRKFNTYLNDEPTGHPKGQEKSLYSSNNYYQKYSNVQDDEYFFLHLLNPLVDQSSINEKHGICALLILDIGLRFLAANMGMHLIEVVNIVTILPLPQRR